ncbi:MAG TPA: hypothetical protein VMV79_05810 [Alphaproteobacteria bacterium]|nr:hypothetical protein [Alphaproteobacteria bacterium]
MSIQAVSHSAPVSHATAPKPQHTDKNANKVAQTTHTTEHTNAAGSTGKHVNKTA